MTENFFVVINENNIPQEITIHDTLDDAIIYIGFYHIIYNEKDGYQKITPENFKEYFIEYNGLWKQKNYINHPMDKNVFILRQEV